MLVVLKIIYTTVLGIISYQDLKERKVTVLLFLLLALVGGYLFYTAQVFEVFLINTSINISFIVMLFFLVLLYVKVKMNVKISEAMGLGDVLFFLVLAISFPTVTFLVLFSCSLFFSLLLFLVVKPMLKIKTVPLAGFQALFLSLVILLNWIFNFVNLYAI
ncbi:MAG: hypothetical protein P8K77_05400 [Polaribacter sp.]|nr:hypothetical protein [Polaribacter sp.]